MDALDAVGDAELRAVLLFARSSERAVTADELAAAHGVHRNVARARLERLVEAGLLEPGYERRTGRTGPGAGRPAKTYAVAPELAAIQFPERDYEALVGLVIDELPRRGKVAALRRVGEAFGDELADKTRLRRRKSLAAGATALCDAVRSLGFHASVEEVAGDRAVIATSTCPLRPLVRAKKEAAEVDRGMWSALAARSIEGVDAARVECETHECLADHAACRVVLQANRL